MDKTNTSATTARKLDKFIHNWDVLHGSFKVEKKKREPRKELKKVAKVKRKKKLKRRKIEVPKPPPQPPPSLLARIRKERLMGIIAVVVAVVIVGAIISVALTGWFARVEEKNKLPVAIAGDDMEVMVGMPVRFDGSQSYDPDGEIVSLHWDFGDGSEGIAWTPLHTYNTIGKFNVVLTVTDDDGAKATDNLTVTVVEYIAYYRICNISSLLSEPELYKDKLVKVLNATVIDAGSYAYGYGTDPTQWVSFEISDASTSDTLTVYAEPGGASRPLELNVSDRVDVQGQFVWYKDGGYWEIKVRVNTDDAIIKVGVALPIQYIRCTIHELLTNPSVYMNCSVIIEAAIVTDAGSYAQGYGADPNNWVNFEISDNTTTEALTVYVEAGATRPLELRENNIVTVQGLFCWYAEGNYWEIKVRKGTTDAVIFIAEGPEIVYTQYTIHELLSEPELHADEYVKIVDAVVTNPGSYAQGYGADPNNWVNFEISDNSTTESLTVYVEAGATRPLELRENNIVAVQGVFYWYEAGAYWEIKVRYNTADAVKFISEGLPIVYTPYTINELLANPEAHLDEYVKLEYVWVTDPGRYAEGVGTEISEYMYFYVSDDSTYKSLDIFVEGYAERPLDLCWNDKLEIQGQFTFYDSYENGIYDPWETWEVKVRQYTMDYVKLVAKAPEVTYKPYTLATLLSMPEAHLGEFVRVEYMLVTDPGRYGEVYSGNPETYVYFYASDNSTRDEIEIYAEPGATRPTSLKYDDYVTVQGVFTFYDSYENGIWDPWETLEIKVRKYSNDSVMLVIEAPPVTYRPYTVAELLQNTTLHELAETTHVYVKVTNATVADLGKFAFSDFTGDPSEYVYFDITDNSTDDSLDIFVEGDATRPIWLRLDDIVTVQGRFTFYDKNDNGKFDEGESWEILVRRYSDDAVILIATTPPAVYTNYTIAELLADPLAHYNEHVRVINATVANPYDYLYDETSYINFYITDASTNATITVFLISIASGPSTLGWDDIVTVQGLWTFWDKNQNGVWDPGELWEIKIQPGTSDAVIKVMDAPPPVYELHSVQELLGAPSTFMNTYVELRNVTVTDPGGYELGVEPSDWVAFFVADTFDAPETLQIYVSGGAVRPDDLDLGDIVTARGKFTYYDTNNNNEFDSGEEELLIRYKSNDRVELVKRADNPPEILYVMHVPEAPTPYEPVTVSAEVIDDFMLVSVTLKYAVDSDTFTDIEMYSTPAEPDVYIAEIPPQPNGAMVKYYIVAMDNVSQTTVAPQGAPNVTYSYTPLDNPPTVSEITHEPYFPKPNNIVNVSAFVTDDIQLAQVMLWYNIGGTGWQSVDMVDDGTGPDDTANDNFYTGSIPPAVVEYVTVQYFVRAYDHVAQATDSAIYEYTVVWDVPPTISALSQLPVKPTYADTVTISVTVTDDNEVTEVKLYYALNDSVGFAEVGMVEVEPGTGHYTAQIPPCPNGTVVRYYINATDNLPQTISEPLDAPDTIYFYTISDWGNILFDNGHGEWDVIYDDVDRFKSAANQQCLTVAEDNVAVAPLSCYDLIVILDPAYSFDLATLEKLVTFVHEGGGLLLLSETDYNNYGRPENINPVLEALGISGRINDDGIQDPTDHYDTSEWIPYFYAANGCFANDTLDISAGVSWIKARSVCSVWNLSTDAIILLNGDDDTYNVDNTVGEHYEPYTSGTYPPLLVAVPTVGFGRVIYGGLASTLSDDNYYGWLDSDIELYVMNLVDWLADVSDYYPQLEAIGHTPAVPTDTDAVTIYAEVTDDSMVSTVILWYSVNDAEELPLLMADDGTGNYTVTLPSFVNGTVVKYRIEAIDDAFQVAKSTINYYIVGGLHIVISEVCYDAPGIDSGHEFIELYNPTGASLPLAGIVLEWYDYSSVTWYSESAIPEGAFIPAYSFYLLGEANVVGADHVITTALENTNGAVRIIDSATGYVIDCVGYNVSGSPLPSDCYEGTPCTDTSSSGYSLERKPGQLDLYHGNWQDTNDNLTDFIENPYPHPQNSSSPPEPPS